MTRNSGILMHITSLPGPYGVGTMGKYAYDFVDFLAQSGQTRWQILPLTPTGYGDSPYQSCSTFAGNHYLIDLDALIDEGLLERQEVADVDWGEKETKADFGRLYRHRLSVLRLAYSRFQGGAEFEAFCEKNASWLPDFGLFMALKERHGGKPWYEWEMPLKRRHQGAIAKAQAELEDEIRFYSFVQFQFFRQWQALHAYAAGKSIRIIGDVPIYVPLDSVEVWSQPELFQLDRSLRPRAVAGCPPDAFTADGQLWGNPLYNWRKMKQDGYAWWIRRLAAAGEMYDIVRIDHFRGLESYWSVPYGDETARGGKWVKGPGMDFIRTIQAALPDLQMIAEDLGFLTPQVLQMRDESGYPGMKVLEFAFDSREPSDYLPHTYPRNCIVYTGTHDNMTMRQWYETASPEAVRYAAEYMALTKQEGLVAGTIRTAMASVADTCIVPMWDWLDLGGEARMNFPGTLSDSNWTWRAKGDIMSEDLSQRIYEMTKLYGRLDADAAHS